jgi:hypothetical protein
MNNIINWFSSLSLAELLGVIGFILSTLIILVNLIRWIVRIPAGKRTQTELRFKLEDVNHEMFKKKGFVSFDLFVRNDGKAPVNILHVGLVMADGSELPIYEEPHKLKTPDISIIAPGQEAFFDNCDLFMTLNGNGTNYKKIIGFYADLRNSPRFYANADIHPLLNDQIVRGLLTDIKGLNGF